MLKRARAAAILAAVFALDYVGPVRNLRQCKAAAAARCPSLDERQRRRRRLRNDERRSFETQARTVLEQSGRNARPALATIY